MKQLFGLVSIALDCQLAFFFYPHGFWNLVARLHLLVPKQSLNTPKLSLA